MHEILINQKRSYQQQAKRMRDHQRQPEDGDGRPEDEPDRDEGDVDRGIRKTPFVKNCLRVTQVIL